MKTLALLCLLSMPAFAQDAGIVVSDDRPVATRLQDGSVLFPPAAYDALDAELRRLQAQEAMHKTENWRTGIVIVSLACTAVGLAAGIIIGGYVTLALQK